jgi:hypothetical protein
MSQAPGGVWDVGNDPTPHNAASNAILFRITAKNKLTHKAMLNLRRCPRIKKELAKTTARTYTNAHDVKRFAANMLKSTPCKTFPLVNRAEATLRKVLRKVNDWNKGVVPVIPCLSCHKMVALQEDAVVLVETGEPHYECYAWFGEATSHAARELAAKKVSKSSTARKHPERPPRVFSPCQSKDIATSSHSLLMREIHTYFPKSEWPIAKDVTADELRVQLLTGSTLLCEQQCTVICTWNGEPDSADMIECFRCHNWFHEECSGIITQNAQEDDFYCEDCVDMPPRDLLTPCVRAWYSSSKRTEQELLDELFDLGCMVKESATIAELSSSLLEYLEESSDHMSLACSCEDEHDDELGICVGCKRFFHVACQNLMDVSRGSGGICEGQCLVCADVQESLDDERHTQDPDDTDEDDDAEDLNSGEESDGEGRQDLELEG